MSEETGARLEFLEGEVICLTSDAPDLLYIIEEGEVGIFNKEKDRVKLTDIKKDKEIINELLPFVDKRENQIAIAMKRTVVVCVSLQDIDAVLETCPNWLRNVLVLITDRLKSTIETLEEHRIVSEKITSYNLPSEQLHKISKTVKEYEKS